MKDGTINVKKKIELCSLSPCRKRFKTAYSKGKLSNGCLEEGRYPLNCKPKAEQTDMDDTQLMMAL